MQAGQTISTITWSNYKNDCKETEQLPRTSYCIAPTGKFPDKCEPYDPVQVLIQTDTLCLNISQECNARLLNLHIPQGICVQIKRTKAYVKKIRKPWDSCGTGHQKIEKFFNLVQRDTCYPVLIKLFMFCASLCNPHEPIFKHVLLTECFEPSKTISPESHR